MSWLLGNSDSSLIKQLTNTINYQLHKATYSPEAEEFAKQKEAEADAEKKQREVAAAPADTPKADLSGASPPEAEQKEAEPEDMNKFSVNRLFKRALDITLQIVKVFVLIALILFGASLATNLNIYRTLPYRIFYAFYGALFFFVVIPYVLLWRWAYKGKRPKFYGLLPILDFQISNPILAALFSWMSFQPDEEMYALDGCN